MTLKLQYRKGEEEHGNGPIIHRWRPHGHTMAVACADSVIYYDKKGNVIDALNPTGRVVDIAWDKEGDVLAIAMVNTGTILLWDVNSRNTESVESGAASSKEMPTCLAWSPTSSTLVVGNNAGNMMVYNHRTSRRIALLGKHQRSVTQLKVTPDDMIVSCSDDNTLTVTQMDGTTVSTATCNGEPTNLDYGLVNRKGANGTTMISAVTNRKILLLASINALDDPVNLQFQEKYGFIVSYTWFNDGYILIGFDRGYIISISAHRNEIGSEINSFLEFRTQMAALAVSTSFNKLLTLGDGMLKVRDLEDISNVSMMTEIDPNTHTKAPELASLDITEDGQLVAVSSVVGVLSCFVTRMPSLAASYNTSVCYLTNLTQVTVVADVDKKGATTLELGVEPNVMGLGPLNLAVANNNTVFFYDYHTPAQVQAAQQLQSTQSAADKPTVVNAEMVNRVEYLSTVTAIQLNYMYAAVQFGNRLRLHRIRNSEDNSSVEFPEDNRNATLYSFALTDNFLVFTTSNNYIVYFSLTEWSVVSEYRHVVPVRSIFPHPTNVICCCFDDRLEALIYSAVDDDVYKLPTVGSSAHYKAALWESFTIDKQTFAVYDAQNIHVFLLTKQHIEGDRIVYVSATRLPMGYTPLSMNKGIVTSLMSNGKLTSVLLESHKTDSLINENSNKDEILQRALCMHRWPTAWKVCTYTNNSSHWNLFAMEALLDSNVTLAIRIFRELGDAAMVAALEPIENIEEKNLLMAQVFTILGRYDEAEPLYLDSSQPMEALNMRRDLLNWPKALVLAETMSPEEIPYLSKEYAQELELTGDHANALVNYEKGVIDNAENSPELMEHNEICQSGIARMAIKTGDLRRGVQMAKQLEGRVVKRDCAIILEQMKQYTEAAQLYEVGLFYDRAAAVCLKANTYAKVGELLDKIKSPKIHIQYGKIMEKEKKWKVAVQCYERGRDYDNQVRLLLDPLNDPDEAVRVVRESRSIEGAKLVAKFFVKLGDYKSAIQFLVMSQCVQEAFELAEKNNVYGEYARAIEEHGNMTQALELAEFYDNTVNDAYMASKFYLQAGQYEKSVNLAFRNADDDECVALAVQCAIKAKNDALTYKVAKFLLGDENGSPKDPEHLFKLYVGLGKTRDAAKTAVVVAQIHLAKGGYRVARDLLFKMHQELRSKMMKIPLDMNKSLMMVHSYMITKPLIARHETLLAARMLIRTCQEIQRFPSHIVEILTSAVVICTQAKLKKSAHRFASQLMSQEYRSRIHKKYQKKIEDIVRKGGKEADLPEPKSPCPFCEHPTSDYAMSCENCKSLIPYCVITGRHIVSEDFSRCPSCEMPGYYSEFRRLSQSNEGCYMCGGELKMAIPEDAKAYLERMDKDYKL